MADAAGVAGPMGNAVTNEFARAIADGQADGFGPMPASFVAAMNGVAPTAPD